MMIYANITVKRSTEDVKQNEASSRESSRYQFETENLLFYLGEDLRVFEEEVFLQ